MLDCASLLYLELYLGQAYVEPRNCIVVLRMRHEFTQKNAV